jgi:hypothetical protein
MTLTATPAFAVVPRIGFGSVTAANTNRDGTGTIVDVLTGAAAGTKINEVVLQATGDPADSVVTLFIYNGSTYLLFDEFDLGNPAAASTTVPGYRYPRRYENLVLPSASWKLAAAITVALTSGAINVFALGCDLT